LPALSAPALRHVAELLLNVFEKEHALLVEINPLFELQDGSFVAGDAKVILDDNVVNPSFHPFLDLPGDIAVLASGGGASMINLDALMRYGGNPANYVEYSGNPPAALVEELTIKVLSKPGLKGCWTVGGTANFTDIYETLSGFVQGLRKITPKPMYPIVVRRDGPRREEAFEMLKQVAKEEGFDFHVYGPEIPMSQTAKIIVDLAYGNSR
jgi:succinyl-CoA synthetase beta subunit